MSFLLVPPPPPKRGERSGRKDHLIYALTPIVTSLPSTFTDGNVTLPRVDATTFVFPLADGVGA